MEDNMTIVLADYASESEYNDIKGVTAFRSLDEHRAALRAAVAEYESKGYSVVVEVCDMDGYKAFCARNRALNTPQTVAAYVVAKHNGHADRVFPELEHQNITVVK